ncbi:MAG: hypothetical protein D6689_21900 [Deltaproteobacteria bacterium]|nr:MAG: hypothetical protein D6689_21900 [Deltaproteobacteria bacterium]
MAAAMAAVATACSASETVVSADLEFDGTCVRCHTGLSAGQVHPTYKLRCVDCHGGDDQVADVPADAASDPAIYRDPDLLARSHVRPKPGLARFFWANGIDDDGDGVVDEGPTFDDPDNPTAVIDPGEIVELGLQGQGAGQFVDSELNRDLNYTRWLNPGDLRVATATCGSQSRAALDEPAVGGCHQGVVETMRRSIMVNNAAVINGAYYGNESWRPTWQAAQPPGRDPRAGAFGYVLDYAAIDSCIDISAVGDPGGRGQPVFDSACLERLAADRDPNAAADAPGNVGLPAFEAVQGTIDALPLGGRTAEHDGVTNPRFEWGGNPLMDPDAALPRLSAPPAEELAAGVPDPVDNVLRGFRAYYPVNYPGSASNFAFTFGTSILPDVARIATNNPFGRGHSSGCTACHMLYDPSGARRPHLVRREQAGGVTEELVADPTTRHREFDPATQDIVDLDGDLRLVGIAVNSAERERTGRDQQRYYSRDHALTTAVTTQQCGLCHAFVTRIDLAYQGMAEDEQRDLLARRKSIRFTTPRGTQVEIHDSLVREEDGNLVLPSGLAVIEAARRRDAELDAAGFVRGGGGCAPEVYTEDCNNDGELGVVTLRRFGPDGEVIEERQLDEDLDGDGVLDLIDHAPREVSVDGRQMRYVYGGANGSTRLMDIHFERGMHCIDCHFLQDVHGDGNLYHTNWDQIEIECEDCHGTLDARATLITSGPNGLNDLRRAVDHDGVPYFVERDGAIIQRSRVTPGLEWRVPQVVDTVDAAHPDFEPRAVEAHASQHMPPAPAGGHNAGSTFGPNGELQSAKLECYSCHMSWVLNCMGCHYNVNLGDDIKTKLEPNGDLIKVAGENETWFNNSTQAAATNFQLLSLMRSPFVLAVDAAADGGRLAPFRSSMQVFVSLNDADGHTVVDNTVFTTFQARDANTGRTNVATSGAAMNQTMPHTVRPAETRDCDWCHALVDDAGRVRNDHILGVTYGVGAGRYPYVGDWVFAAGAGGLELFEYKQERELKGNTPGASTRFPGLIVNPTDRVAAAVEPVFDGSLGVGGAFEGTGVVLIRNVTPEATRAPTLRDVAVMTVAAGNAGKLIVADVTRRGHPSAVRPSVGDAASVFVLDLPGGPALGVAALSPDVSDPFVYVAHGAAGVSVVRIDGAPDPVVPAAALVATAPVGGAVVQAVFVAGDIVYAGTDTGDVVAIDVRDPAAPQVRGSVAVGAPVRAFDAAGFALYAGTDGGLAILDISDPANPRLAPGLGAAPQVTGFAARGVAHTNGHVYVAAGAGGVKDVDLTRAAPAVSDVPADAGIDARDVIVSVVPGQTWLLVADGAGDLVGIKLDRALSPRERCLPDNDCGLDADWRDPTILGRDPSLDPDTGAPLAGDPSGPRVFRMAGALLSRADRLARPALWEQVGTQTGRRLRDSFMPGSGVLSLGVMQRMYNVRVCEVPGTADVDGNGLGELGYADGGTCTPFAGRAAARPWWVRALSRPAR